MTPPPRLRRSTAAAFRGLVAGTACAAVLLTSLGNEGLLPEAARGVSVSTPADGPRDGHPAVDLLRSREFAVAGQTVRPAVWLAAPAVASPVSTPSAHATVSPCGPRPGRTVALHALLCVWRI